MRALVTGGGGFIGSHLVDRLLNDGHDVRVLDNFATGRRENLLHVVDDVEIVEGDIQSYERAHTAVRDVEVVFHSAALPSVPRSIQDPLTSNAVNVVGTLNLLLAARDSGVRRVVYASSSSVYGADPTLPKHEGLPTVPLSPYGASKLAGEHYCRSFSGVYDLETVALRYFNVFGPRQDPLSQYAAVVPRFLTSLMEGRSPTIYGDGEQSRDFTFVGNVVHANMLAAGAPAEAVDGLAFNVACGERYSLLDLFEEARLLTGSDLEPRHEPARAGEVKHSQADVSLARERLGYTPTTTFQEGLRHCAAFFAERTSVAANR
jgi:UDP-glucose 4-epimerase